MSLEADLKKVGFFVFPGEYNDMKYKIKYLLSEERGDATYTGVIIFTVIAMIGE